MKKLWNGFKIAFSMYSRIPMPESRWNEENQTYAMVFFPWVGAVVAGVFLGVWQLREWALARGVLESDIFWSGALVLVPFLITGGIHMDGFMDTRDALSACAPRERRLEILKDPHTGAFAVISCGLYLMAMLGLYGTLHWRTAAVTAAGFVLSRILSGLSVVTFPKAKKEGTAAALAEAAGEPGSAAHTGSLSALSGSRNGAFGGHDRHGGASVRRDLLCPLLLDEPETILAGSPGILPDIFCRCASCGSRREPWPWTWF